MPRWVSVVVDSRCSVTTGFVVTEHRESTTTETHRGIE